MRFHNIRNIKIDMWLLMPVKTKSLTTVKVDDCQQHPFVDS